MQTNVVGLRSGQADILGTENRAFVRVQVANGHEL